MLPPSVAVATRRAALLNMPISAVSTKIECPPGVNIFIKNRNSSVILRNQNFSEISNLDYIHLNCIKMNAGVKLLEIFAENSWFFVFLSIYAHVFHVFWVNICVFQEKFSGNTDQKSKLFPKWVKFQTCSVINITA